MVLLFPDSRRTSALWPVGLGLGLLAFRMSIARIPGVESKEGAPVREVRRSGRVKG